MNRWQKTIWVGAFAVLMGGWATPAFAQSRQAVSTQQGNGTCQQGATSGVNAATSAKQNAISAKTASSQSIGAQNPYQRLTPAQMAMMMQYMAQLNALQQQMGQTANPLQSYSGQNVTLNLFQQQRAAQNANSASSNRSVAR
jgi:hypothetical protein